MLIGVYNDRRNPLQFMAKERIDSLIKEAEKHQMTLAFFELDAVDFKTEMISASISESGTWVKKTIPFPLLVMNQSSTTPDNVKDLKKEQQLRQSVPFLSHLIDNKQTIYEQLKKHEAIEPFLIPSIPLRKQTDFFAFQKQHGSILLKPANSSKGKGIIVINKKAGGQYIVSEQNKQKSLSFTDVQATLNRLIRQGNYLIQPFIRSQTKDGRTFHLRVHVIRNANAEWTCLTVIADIAQKGRTTSNHDDSATVPGQEFLMKQYGEDKGTNLYKQIIHLTLDLAQKIDSLYPFSLSELAMDYGVDPDEAIRFYEANTGPEIIALREEREPERAMHLMAYVKTLGSVLESVPIEQRRGRHFKVGK